MSGTGLLNYDAYTSDSWDPARHASEYIGCAFIGYGGQDKAGTVAAMVVPTFQASATHNKNLLESWDSFTLDYGGVALCSYTVNGRTVFVCMVAWGGNEEAASKYGTFSGMTLEDYGCTLDDIHNCTIR